MTVRRALLALALLVFAGAQLAAQPHGPHSLVVARWISDSPVEFPCPEPAICAGEIVDAAFVEVRTLAGPRVPARLTVRLHTTRIREPGVSYLALLMIRPEGAGMPWAGRLMETAIPGHDNCIRSDWFTALGLALPRRSYRRGDRTCFPAA